MHLSELKAIHVSELITMGEALEIENVARMRKQELMFAIMKKRARAGEQVFGDGVLEVLPDGFGRAAAFACHPFQRTSGCRGSRPARPGPKIHPNHSTVRSWLFETVPPAPRAATKDFTRQP